MAKLFFAVADVVDCDNKVIDDEKSIGDDPSFSSNRFHIDFEDFQKIVKIDPKNAIVPPIDLQA